MQLSSPSGNVEETMWETGDVIVVGSQACGELTGRLPPRTRASRRLPGPQSLLLSPGAAWLTSHSMCGLLG